MERLYLRSELEFGTTAFSIYISRLRRSRRSKNKLTYSKPCASETTTGTPVVPPPPSVVLDSHFKSPYSTSSLSLSNAGSPPSTYGYDSSFSIPRASLREIKALFQDSELTREAASEPPVRPLSNVSNITDVSVVRTLSFRGEPTIPVNMSRRNSYNVDSFSAANSFDEIGDELADERTHDFDQVDDSLEDAVDRYASKPLPPTSSADMLSDLDPSDLTDSQKGTYHVLSTTRPREVLDEITDSDTTPISIPIPPPPPPPPARALGTITSNALPRTEDVVTSDDDTVYTDEDSPHHRGIEDTITHDLTNPTVLTTTQAASDSEDEELPSEIPRAVSYRNEASTNNGSTFTFARSPFVGITTPSGRYNSQRLSGRNMSEALVSIWDRFWSDDMKKIVRIFRHRFKELLPHIRKFLAHVVAFWGGVTYIRRALTAFVRVMQRDSRVRELLARLGWASSTTLRVFMSLCAMVLQGSLQFYFLLRNRIIPQLRRVIPKCYYKATSGLLGVARRSPWMVALGPFSLTAAIESKKIPDPYLLHNKFGVPQHDTSFDFGTYASDTFASSIFFGRGRNTGTKTPSAEEPTSEEVTLRESTFRSQPTISSNARTGQDKSQDLTVGQYDGKENDYEYGEVSSVDYKDF